MKSFIKQCLVISLFALGLSAYSAQIHAEEDVPLPSLPAPIQSLVNDGAQIRYLGHDHGLDAWITIKNGQEQYFYVMPDGKAFLMGVLFDEDGKLVTVRQVQKLQQKGDTFLDSMTNDEFAGLKKNPAADQDSAAFKTPSERLYFDLENSNWIELGQPNAPVVYAFVDPQCPHCHKLVEDLRKSYLPEGKIALRMIPVGFKDETRAQSAYLLAAPNPQERWYAHLDGDKEALPAKDDINQQGVQRNLAIMQNWKFSVTPMIVYRDKNGVVKIIRGNPKDLKGMIADLGERL